MVTLLFSVAELTIFGYHLAVPMWYGYLYIAFLAPCHDAIREVTRAGAAAAAAAGAGAADRKTAPWTDTRHATAVTAPERAPVV